MNTSCVSRHPYVVLNTKWKALNMSSLRMTLWIPIIRLKKFLYFWLAKKFIRNGCLFIELNFIKCFICVFTEMIIWFLSIILLMGWIMLIDFSMVTILLIITIRYSLCNAGFFLLMFCWRFLQTCSGVRLVCDFYPLKCPCKTLEMRLCWPHRTIWGVFSLLFLEVFASLEIFIL